jgi:hypothetical protein
MTLSGGGGPHGAPPPPRGGVMRFRTYKNTDLTVSEVGFGLWTISTGWWGNFTEGEAIALMHKAFDLGVTLFRCRQTLLFVRLVA